MVSEPGRDSDQKFIEALGATALRLGRCYSVLADVMILAGKTPGLSDEQLRAALVALADRAVRELGGESR